MHRCQGPGSSVSAQLFLTPPPSPPAASSSAPGRHGDPNADEGVHLCWGRPVARQQEGVEVPVPGGSQGSNPALHAVSCQGEVRHITLEKLGKENTSKNNNIHQNNQLWGEEHVGQVHAPAVKFINSSLFNLNSTNHPWLMIKCSNIPFPNINRVLYKLISGLSILRQKAGRLRERWRWKGGDRESGGSVKREKRNWGMWLCNYQYVLRGQRNKLVVNWRIWLC